MSLQDLCFPDTKLSVRDQFKFIAQYLRGNSTSQLITAANQVKEFYRVDSAESDKRNDAVGLGGVLPLPRVKGGTAIIEALVRQGCHADDWAQIYVPEDFGLVDSTRIRNSRFSGQCVMGQFSSAVEVMPNVTLPGGIYDSLIVNTEIGSNCLVQNVRILSNAVVESGAVLFNVDSISCSGAATFGCGQLLPVAVEVGGRELPCWPEISLSAASLMVEHRENKEELKEVYEALGVYKNKITSAVTWIREGARVVNTSQVVDSYIGFGASIDGALCVRQSCIYSSTAEPTLVSDGAQVHSAILQWGVTVTAGGVVRNSILLEHSGVHDQGRVVESLVAPNSNLAKGEISNSFVGPFVGFHHQSLLISVFWPTGKGNVAYGAMLGSNHTGRLADQELWPCEGGFFGLGCMLRLPTDMSQAPYCLVAASVSCLPQKITFPFSLITLPDNVPEGVSPAFNAILPGWCLYKNAYSILRSELKHKQRNKAVRHPMEYRVMRPDIINLTITALKALGGWCPPDTPVELTLKKVYLETDIPGLGKNYCRENARQNGLQGYRNFLLRYALRKEFEKLFAESVEETGHDIVCPEKEDLELSAQIMNVLLPPSPSSATSSETDPIKQHCTLLLQLEKEHTTSVVESKRGDDVRGKKTIPGYEFAHTSAEEDAVCKYIKQQKDQLVVQIDELLTRKGLL